MTASKKKDGGHRPIAVGDMFRRLVSRICCSAIQAKASNYLLPAGQLGVGTKGGVEACIHLARLYIDHHCTKFWIYMGVNVV